ncbi:hypothetical protein Tco_0170830, partial [Tanacetum coccineum]
KIETAEQVDPYILAGLPDPKEDTIGNKIVSDLMMHNPFGRANSNAPCMQKGPDRILAKISKPIGEASTSGGNNRVQIDKIQNFIDGHFICPHEACWMILDFPIHSREPAMKFMSVNLENMQRIKYRERGQLGNDREWDITLEEATITCSSSELRSLFV